ncbi:MAG TPA: class I SAM-dependent methyltransferase [Thermoleophilaceae bacterium]
METIASANEEAIEAWNGVLFDRFVAYRDVVTNGLGAHGEEGLKWSPPRAGERVLDIGCGFGDTTQQLGQLVGPEGEALGVDVAERFIETARAEAAEAGTTNVRFVVADVQVAELERGFDYAFSRMGVMFFANPVAALRNVRRSLVPGGRLCAVVWRRKSENEWMSRAEEVVARFDLAEEAPEEPTCGPGPFSMGDADVTSQQLLSAGFEEVALRRCDLPIKAGDDVASAVQFALALGPAGEAIRKAGPAAERIRPEIEAALAETLSEFARPDGAVWAPASTWIVTARVPDA